MPYVPFTDHSSSGQRMNLQTIRCFTRAIRYGSKYIYQTLPRILTIWLDMAEDPARIREQERAPGRELDRELDKSDIFGKINSEVHRAIKSAPVYKVPSWLDIALPLGLC